MKARARAFTWPVLTALTVALSVVLVQAQTPGRVPMFDVPGTGYCNSTGGNDCIDSVITRDASKPGLRRWSDG